MYDLIIIGGGPAGLAAAVYALRQHLKLLLIGDQMGGRVGWRLDVPWLENRHSISGEEVVRTLKAELQLRHLPRVLDRAIQIDALEDHYRVRTATGEFTTRALLLSTGASPQRMGVPGEETFYLRGLSYSAITYASAMLDKTVAVIGDGPLALRSAAELARAAARVYLVAGDPACRATAWGQWLAALPHLTWLLDYQVEAIYGDDYVEALAVRGPAGLQTLKVNCIFVEIGLQANAGLVTELVDCDAQGHVRVDNRNRTSRPGLFAAGDVTDVHAEQVLIAIGEGAKAALSISEYLATWESGAGLRR
ncbi:MAG: FAD-dependent oxidoreductase [Anaerolineae bacterium]